MRRRAARMARPARVRIRRRNPCVLARRRLFGWNVRLLTGSPRGAACANRRDRILRWRVARLTSNAMSVAAGVRRVRRYGDVRGHTQCPRYRSPAVPMPTRGPVPRRQRPVGGPRAGPRTGPRTTTPSAGARHLSSPQPAVVGATRALLASPEQHPRLGPATAPVLGPVRCSRLWKACGSTGGVLWQPVTVSGETTVAGT